MHDDSFSILGAFERGFGRFEGWGWRFWVGCLVWMMGRGLWEGFKWGFWGEIVLGAGVRGWLSSADEDAF